MNAFNILKFIYNHPFNASHKIGGLVRFFQWQLNCRLNPYPIVYTFTEHSRLILFKGLTSATGNLYCGLMEYEDMGFLLHFLRPDDLFLDIGANVGTYTVLAAAEIKAKVIAIEPVPSTFKNLEDNMALNQIQANVKALNIGLGSERGKLNFTQSLDVINHVAEENEKDTIAVDVSTVDFILATEQVPVLIKMDVEGFETEVLLGAASTLSQSNLKAIIIELNGSGVRYGYDENEIHKKLLHHGFKPFTYHPASRQLKEVEGFGKHNTIYIRDQYFVQDRITRSRKIRVGSAQHFI